MPISKLSKTQIQTFMELNDNIKKKVFTKKELKITLKCCIFSWGIINKI